MRNLALAILLLMAAVHTTAADEKPTESVFRSHDATFLEQAGFDDFGLTRMLSVEFESGQAPNDTLNQSPVWHSGRGAYTSLDPGYLERFAKSIGAGFSCNWTCYVERMHGRTLLCLQAPQWAHGAVDEMLARLRGYLDARVHVQVRDTSVGLFGTSQGRLGQNITIRESFETRLLSDSERHGTDTRIPYTSPMDAGTQVSLWAVKLPDGRLSVQGNIIEVREIGQRVVKTEYLDLQVPMFTSGFQPFAVRLGDPGVFTLRAASGREFEISLSCGYTLPAAELAIQGSAKITTQCLAGALWRRADVAWMVAAGPSASFGPSIIYPEEGFSGDPSAGWFEDRIRYSNNDFKGVAVEAIGPFLLYREGGDSGVWETVLDLQREFAQPDWRSYRIRVWELPEGSSADDVPREDPLEDHRLTIRRGAAASCNHLQVTRLAEEYVSWWSEPSDYRGPALRETVLNGSQTRVEWKYGEVQARFCLRRAPDGISSVDTRIDPDGRISIESLRCTDIVLNWRTRDSADRATAMTPISDGKVLFGLLERIE